MNRTGRNIRGRSKLNTTLASQKAHFAAVKRRKVVKPLRSVSPTPFESPVSETNEDATDQTKSDVLQLLSMDDWVGIKRPRTYSKKRRQAPLVHPIGEFDFGKRHPIARNYVSPQRSSQESSPEPVQEHVEHIIEIPSSPPTLKTPEYLAASLTSTPVAQNEARSSFISTPVFESFMKEYGVHPLCTPPRQRRYLSPMSDWSLSPTKEALIHPTSSERRAWARDMRTKLNATKGSSPLLRKPAREKDLVTMLPRRVEDMDENWTTPPKLRTSRLPIAREPMAALSRNVRSSPVILAVNPRNTLPAPNSLLKPDEQDWKDFLKIDG